MKLKDDDVEEINDVEETMVEGTMVEETMMRKGQ